MVLAVAEAPFIQIIVDAKYIIRAFYNGPNKTKYGSNPELWDRFWTLLERRGGRKSVQLIKVKSHLSQEEVNHGIAKCQHIAANEAADRLADQAAQEIQVPKDTVDRFNCIERRAWALQNRIIAVFEHVFAHDRPRPKSKIGSNRKITTSDSIQDLRELGHEMHQLESKYRCISCMRGVAKSGLPGWINEGECLNRASRGNCFDYLCPDTAGGASSISATRSGLGQSPSYGTHAFVSSQRQEVATGAQQVDGKGEKTSAADAPTSFVDPGRVRAAFRKAYDASDASDIAESEGDHGQCTESDTKTGNLEDNNSSLDLYESSLEFDSACAKASLSDNANAKASSSGPSIAKAVAELLASSPAPPPQLAESQKANIEYNRAEAQKRKAARLAPPPPPVSEEVRKAIQKNRFEAEQRRAKRIRLS